jgi:hypothetical protein
MNLAFTIDRYAFLGCFRFPYIAENNLILSILNNKKCARAKAAPRVP